MNDKLLELISKRAELSKRITNDDPEKMNMMSDFLDLCVQINEVSPNNTEFTSGMKKIERPKEKNELLFQLPDEPSYEEKIVARDKKIQEKSGVLELESKDLIDKFFKKLRN